MSRRIIAALGLGLLLSIFPAQRAVANLLSCDISASPGQVYYGDSVDFQFNVQANHSNTTIRYIRITRPSSSFTLLSASVPGWNVDVSADEVVLSGGSIEPQEELFIFNVHGQVAGAPASGGSWEFYASDAADGSGQVNCGGEKNVNVVSPPFELSNISSTILSATSVRITWNSAIPASSRVDYGLTSSYDTSSPDDPTPTTNHSVTLADLSPSTGYHYQVVSTGEDQTVVSSDNTFTTPSEQTEVQPQTETHSGQQVAAPQSIVSSNPNARDKTPPTAKLLTKLEQPFKTPPLIKGEAEDNIAVTKVEYSLDGGNNWLKANTVKDLGKKKVSFEFTPENLEDNNYLVVARALDEDGNIGMSATIILVMDNLPPSVGGNVISLGPQVLTPTEQGLISTLVGVDQKITLSAIGGPTSIKVMAKKAGNSDVTHSFSLTRLPQTKLWNGLASFLSPGNYELTAEATDGANNHTTQKIGQVRVQDTPRLIDFKTRASISGGKTTVYYLDPETDHWVVWDGAAYGLNNPQKVNDRGSFSYVLPAGKYYIEANANGYQSVATRSFEIKQTEVFAGDIEMQLTRKFSLLGRKLSLPSPFLSTIYTQPTQLDSSAVLPAVAEQLLPAFKLPSTRTSEISDQDLHGSPTLITVVSSWSPPSQDQLQALAELQKNSDVNVLVVFNQESISLVKGYLAISKYNLKAVADKDGELSRKLGAKSLPTHYFVNGQGTVKMVKVGNFTGKELLEKLTGAIN